MGIAQHAQRFLCYFKELTRAVRDNASDVIILEYIEAAEEVDRFSLAWTYLVAQALNPAESAAMIRELAQRSSRE